MTEAVLAGVRVLDLGRFIAAPFCGLLLADRGAEVIRVERPGGELDRRLGLRAANGECFTFASLARNKKGITLDVRRVEAARQVIVDLAARCDVFLHNFSPDAARALKLTYDDLRAVRPDVVYTGISCYGGDGPYAGRNGFDPMAQVNSGAAALTGSEDDPPLRAGVSWVDYATGLAAALGTVLALRHRDATGEGQAVDCALLQTAVSFTAPMIAEAVVAGRERPRLGNQPPDFGPCNLYRCQDGWVYVATVTPGTWRALAELIGRGELGAAPELDTAERRFEQRHRVEPPIEAWMARRTAQQAVAELEAARVPCGIYRSTAEVPDDPQVRALGMLGYVDLETPGLESVPVSGPVLRMSRSPAAAAVRAPRVGEHNREIYSGLLGYGDERLAALAAAGVI
jgi:crotonobetainyl-CoA:carnitine CoA-transferase CaiB-like acyl-CoA transferase